MCVCVCVCVCVCGRKEKGKRLKEQKKNKVWRFLLYLLGLVARMNKLGKKGSTFHDTVPMLRQAGKSTAVSGESAENCVRHDGEDGEQRPATPPHMKKYRLSTLHEPGRIVRHYGLADDPIMDGPFGRSAFSYGEDGVSDVIKSRHGEVRRLINSYGFVQGETIRNAS